MSSGAGVVLDKTDDAGVAAAPASRHAQARARNHHTLDAHVHDHRHGDPDGHAHGHGEDGYQAPIRPQLPGFSLMRVSLGERLLLSAGLSALLWIAIAGVLWA